MQPLVSILVLCYNHENYVESCIKSIIEQQYDNLEVVIIDNGSTDLSCSLIDNYISVLSEKYSRVEFIKNNENLGIPKAMNQGVDWAKGKYIKEISSDDIMYNDCIDNLVGFYESNLPYDFIVGNGYFIDEKFQYGTQVIEDSNKLIYKCPPDFDNNYFERLLLRNNIAAPAVMIKRETFLKYGKYDTSLPFEDWDFWLNVVANGGKAGYTEIPIVYYRRSSQSITVFEKGKKQDSKKFELYYYNNMAIFEKYKVHLLKDKTAKFEKYIFEKYFLWAIKMDYIYYVKLIYNDAIKKRIEISIKNRTKYILYTASEKLRNGLQLWRGKN